MLYINIIAETKYIYSMRVLIVFAITFLLVILVVKFLCEASLNDGKPLKVKIYLIEVLLKQIIFLAK